MHDPLISILAANDEYLRLERCLNDGNGPATVFGLGENQKIHFTATLSVRTNKTILVVTSNENSAARFSSDMSEYFNSVSHFPINDMPLNSFDFVASPAISTLRLNVLEKLLSGAPQVICISIGALLRRITPPDILKGSYLGLNIAERIDLSATVEKLINMGYERVDICEGRGQFCIRGGYLDIYPPTHENPIRIELFDDEIDTMREYDAQTQRSLSNIDATTISPFSEMVINNVSRKRAINAMKKRKNLLKNVELLEAGGVSSSLLTLLPFIFDEAYLTDYLPKDALILLDEPLRLEESAKIAYAEFLDMVSSLMLAGAAEKEQGDLLCTPNAMIRRLDTGYTAMLSTLPRSFSQISPKNIFKFESRMLPQYTGMEQTLVTDIIAWRKNTTTVLIYAGKHAQRVCDILMDSGVVAPVVSELNRAIIRGEILIFDKSLARGFEYPEMHFAVITENELFGISASRRQTQQKRKSQLAFSELQIGDLVVHELHGIGRFVGVESLTAAGVTRDYLKLIYAGSDKLYIPTDQLDRVQKYIGGGEEKAKLSSLGTGEWQRTVSRTRESVKKLAFDLVQLYGERTKRAGFKYSQDTSWQHKLEENFAYEETPDQLTCIDEIKHDMESGKVMDRLLCGDVGYGKTEVALRVAFKAVMDGKQVAFLVPTTILAQQHYNTFVSRFSGFPVQVAMLSRFNTPQQEKKALDGLKNGTVDVVVGTHKLLGKIVKFRDLGLLIIDEEQRFGVGHKEQIKDLKRAVDVLTLSATPIPRTLHMSMTGIRDMSVIETPPEQRYPVQTYVMEYNDAIIREAILKELGRKGQVYFVYNKVRNMERFAQYLRELVPDARIAYAHGQMSERTLEKTMLDFMEYQYDVLLCSTIIESGLDIQNVNTIIIYDADCMGLSQLYQLRGRVGRGARLGYAYLTFKHNKIMNEDAEKRLAAVKEFTQFGAGFKIAMRDLEIRGAGNLLGPEQSGHMMAVGYDMYCKIVDGAIKEARGEVQEAKVDTAIDMPIPAGIPHEYIPRESDRLAMYKRIAMIGSNDDVMDIQDELIDRFGEIPKNVSNLISIAKLKADASKIFITSISVKEGEVKIQFTPDAPLDGAKLYSAIGTIQGAQMLNVEMPTLFIRRKKAVLTDLIDSLPQFVYTLNDCVMQN